MRPHKKTHKFNFKKMTKTVLLFIFSCIGISMYAQDDNALEKQFGIEANLIGPGIGASYELPLSRRFLADLYGGLGTPILKGWGAIAIDDSHFKPYTRVAVKYYYNRDRRVRKGKEINNNRGNFLGIQNKMMYALGDYSPYSTFALNEIYWGVQTEAAKKLLLTFHIGFAHYYTTGQEHYYSPLIDLKLKYILF